MFTLDNLFLLLTGLLAAFLSWYFWKRYRLQKKPPQCVLPDGIRSPSGFRLAAHFSRPGYSVFALCPDGRQPDPAGHIDGIDRRILPDVENAFQVVRCARFRGNCRFEHRRT